MLLLLSLVACRSVAFTDQASLLIEGTAAPVVAEPAAPRPERIELRDKIQFAYDSDRILADSYPVLDEVVDAIEAHQDIAKIRIEGHASADGNDRHNLMLSAARAESVRKYLVDKGIDAQRLVAEGFGELRPIADNTTPQGREENRRVELHIVEWTP
jgi:outer membrane protein OmpA-like peptidoglycan-associated protein